MFRGTAGSTIHLAHLNISMSIFQFLYFYSRMILYWSKDLSREEDRHSGDVNAHTYSSICKTDEYRFLFSVFLPWKLWATYTATWCSLESNIVILNMPFLKTLTWEPRLKFGTDWYRYIYSVSPKQEIQPW